MNDLRERFEVSETRSLPALPRDWHSRWAICPDVVLDGPAQQRRAYRETGAHRGQQHQIAFLQLAFLAGGVHRQRNGSRGGVAVSDRY